ncbi:MAG: hypothetical protein JWN72_2672, partial [Thermoleophilia bacterium]|nr:hypothetical protein [Thermoleophilia bacterium]
GAPHGRLACTGALTAPRVVRP